MIKTSIASIPTAASQTCECVLNLIDTKFIIPIHIEIKPTTKFPPIVISGNELNVELSEQSLNKNFNRLLDARVGLYLNFWTKTTKNVLKPKQQKMNMIESSRRLTALVVGVQSNVSRVYALAIKTRRRLNKILIYILRRFFFFLIKVCVTVWDRRCCRYNICIGSIKNVQFLIAYCVHN